MRALRIIGIIIGCIVAMLIAALIALWLTVNPNDYRRHRRAPLGPRCADRRLGAAR